MTATTETPAVEYGFRTNRRDGADERVFWADRSGKVRPYTNGAYRGEGHVAAVDATDLSAMHAAAKRFRDASGHHGIATVEVVSRPKELLTVVPEPKPEIDPKLDGLKPGSVVLAKWHGEEGAWVLSTDGDSIPWHGVSGPDLGSWASPRNLTVVSVLHAER